MKSAPAGEVLRARAAALAEPLTTEADDQTLEVLFVGLANGTKYALPIHAVQQISAGISLCRLPTSSDPLIAVAVLGGAALPVADLASVLGGAPSRQDRPFLVVLGESDPLGVLVDEVIGVVAVRESALRPLPNVPDESATNLHRWLTPNGELLIDTAALLEDSRLAVPRASYLVPTSPTPRHPGAT